MLFKLLRIGLILAVLSSVGWAAVDWPAPNGFINDYAGVLTAAEKQNLDALVFTLKQKTGAEMAVAIVKTVAPLDAKTYAVKLFEKWKIGQKGKDNGLLILLALEERRVEIEVGYGLEGVINDAKAGEILDKYVVPFFKTGEFGAGLYNGAVVIAGEIAKSAGQELGANFQPAAPVKGSDDGGLLENLIMVAIILLTVFGSGIIWGLVGAALGGFFGFLIAGVLGAIIGAIFGFVLSYFKIFGRGGGWMGGLGSGGGFGGGGFGGGSSGGGGSGRSW